MGTPQEQRSVTVVLPPEVYERALGAASRRGTPVETLLAALVDDGLERKERLRLGWQRLSDAYRERLAREGRLEQTPDEVFADLGELREQVARELRP